MYYSHFTATSPTMSVSQIIQGKPNLVQIRFYKIRQKAQPSATLLVSLSSTTSPFTRNRILPVRFPHFLPDRTYHLGYPLSVSCHFSASYVCRDSLEVFVLLQVILRLLKLKYCQVACLSPKVSFYPLFQQLQTSLTNRNCFGVSLQNSCKDPNC